MKKVLIAAILLAGAAWSADPLTGAPALVGGKDSTGKTVPAKSKTDGTLVISCPDGTCSGGGGGPSSSVAVVDPSTLNPLGINLTGQIGVSNFPASFDITDRVGRALGAVSVSGSVAVTGTFWQVTQPVSGTFWQATQPVSGTFWQATQPVSIATMPSTPVTGTFWQATQPVSIATMPSTPVTGTFWQVTQPVSGAFFQATQPVSLAAAIDISDRVGRLLGVTYGSQGQQIKQTATNFNSQVEIAVGAALIDPRAIRALTSADVVSINGTVPVSGTFWQATQPVSGTFFQATQPVSIAATVNTSDAHTTAAAPLSCQLSDGAAFYAGTKTGQLPTALDGSGFLKVHEQGTAAVSGTVTANQGGAPWSVIGGVANDTSAIGNGAETQPAVARAAPTAVTAGRSEKEQVDAATGAQFMEPVATTAATGLSQKGYTANTALNIKASAGNVYGWTAINAAAAVCWLQFYNTAGTPTCGTAVIWSVPLPVTPGVSNIIVDLPIQNHATGIGICVSTTATGGTTCGSTSSGTIFFK